MITVLIQRLIEAREVRRSKQCDPSNPSSGSRRRLDCFSCRIEIHPASAVPEARTHRTPIGGGIACWLPASSIDPLCGRDDVGRMVREPCRGPASSLSATPDEVPRRWRAEASPSVSSSVRGRGEDRDMVSLVASQASWLSQAIWVVNLRLPLDRRTIARAGARSPLARREQCNVRSKYFCVRNSVVFLSH